MTARETETARWRPGPPPGTGLWWVETPDGAVWLLHWDHVGSRRWVWPQVSRASRDHIGNCGGHAPAEAPAVDRDAPAVDAHDARLRALAVEMRTDHRCPPRVTPARCEQYRPDCVDCIVAWARGQ